MKEVDAFKMTISAQGKRDEIIDKVFNKHYSALEDGCFDGSHLTDAIEMALNEGYSLARNEANVLVEAIKTLYHHCYDYGLTDDNIAILFECEKARKILAAYEKGDV